MSDWRAVAASQYGLVSRTQLLDAGLRPDAIWRRVKAGVLEAPLPGVLRVAGAPRSWHQELLAACLWAGPSAAASHQAAAALWGMPGFTPGPVVVSGCRKARPPAASIVVHRVTPERRFICTTQGIPATNPSRTLMDLAAVTNSASVERALDEMLRQGRTSLRQLRWGIKELNGPGRRGVGALGRIVDARDPAYEPSVNEFQARVLSRLRRAGIKGAVDEYEGRGADGSFIGRADIVFPAERLVIECDGYASHAGRREFEHDRVRGNAMVRAGYQVLHVTWYRLVQDPAGFLDEVRDALEPTPRLTRR